MKLPNAAGFLSAKHKRAFILLVFILGTFRIFIYGLLIHHTIKHSNRATDDHHLAADVPAHIIHINAERRPEKASYFIPVSQFMMEPDLLVGKRHNFVIFVISFAQNHKRREIIRKTWANLQHLNKSTVHSFNVQRLFVIGDTADLTEPEKKKITDEQVKYHDLLSVPSVVNSTLSDTIKELNAIYYIINKFRDDLDYVLKSDDTTFVNMDAVLSTSWYHTDGKHTSPDLLCYYLDEKKEAAPEVFKDHLQQFEPDVYPRHCTGPVYVAGAAVLQRMANLVLQEPLIQNTNALLTGEALQSTGDVIVYDVEVEEILFYEDNLGKGKNPVMSDDQLYAMNLPVDRWEQMFISMEKRHKH